MTAREFLDWTATDDFMDFLLKLIVWGVNLAPKIVYAAIIIKLTWWYFHR